MIIKELDGQEILKSEARAAIQTMKLGKSSGDDGVMIEMLKAGGEIMVDKITGRKLVYNTRIIPEEMGNSESRNSRTEHSA